MHVDRGAEQVADRGNHKKLSCRPLQRAPTLKIDSTARIENRQHRALARVNCEHAHDSARVWTSPDRLLFTAHARFQKFQPTYIIVLPVTHASAALAKGLQ